MKKIATAAQRTGAHAPEQGAPTRDFGDSPLRVGILLWPSFPMMSLAGMVESLRHAGDHGDSSKHRYATWDVLGTPGSRTVSSCGIEIEATAAYPSPTHYDYVFVIGGLLRDLDKAPQRHRDYLHATRNARRPLIGVCTGSFVLAEEGILDGRPVCVHPYHERDFNAALPGHRLVLSKDFVTDDEVTTVLGGVSILPFMLRIIGTHFGPDRSAKTVHQMTLPSPDWSSDLSAIVRRDHEGITDPRIQKALVLLDAQATQSPSIAKLSRSLGLSERHFLRLFRAQVGRSPKTYLVDTKLRAATWMLRHTTRSVTEVAYATGFSSGANLADHCQKRLGISPTRLRQTALLRDEAEETIQ